MTLSERLSALKIFADVVADATRRLHAGELDAAAYMRVLQRQGFTAEHALIETIEQSIIRTIGAP